jgi:hypothetical protein
MYLGVNTFIKSTSSLEGELMGLDIIYAPKDSKYIFAISGGKNPITSFQEMRFIDEQLDVCLTREEKLQYRYMGRDTA